ncbi:T9SS type A sorting domain-containing protein [Gemmatimonas aurantiaca]|nr:T9SS type A sorting domain-containing protein [Gemmatimonas aurantiaca]
MLHRLKLKELALFGALAVAALVTIAQLAIGQTKPSTANSSAATLADSSAIQIRIEFPELRPEFSLTITEIPDGKQGSHQLFSIIYHGEPLELGGFDLLISFDGSVATLVTVQPGNLVKDNSWEYFGHRAGPTQDNLRSVSVNAIAELPDREHPTSVTVHSGDTLAQIDLIISTDRNIACQFIPVRWFWNRCSDNTLFAPDNNTVYAISQVFDYVGSDDNAVSTDERKNITNLANTFPTLYGAPADCDTLSAFAETPPQSVITFKNGGITIVCHDSLSRSVNNNLTITIGDTIPPWRCGYVDVQYITLPITISEGTLDIGGFDFLLSYDTSYLHLDAVLPGPFIAQSDWGYFTYRAGAANSRVPPGDLRVVGIGQVGNHRPEFTITVGDTLALLKFRTNVYRYSTYQERAIRWLWRDCGDNNIASPQGDTLFLNDRVFGPRLQWPNEFYGERVELTERNTLPPTIHGSRDTCLLINAKRRPILRQIDYNAGGVFSWGPDCIDSRGDLSIDGSSYELRDMQIFARYLTRSDGDFLDNQHELYEALSDANRNDVGLEISDLAFFARMLSHDDIPPSLLDHDRNTLHITQRDNTFSVDREAGAALFVFAGDVPVTLLQEQMELRTGYRDGKTYALVYDISESVDAVAIIHSGALLASFGRLDSVAAAEYHGERLVTKFNHKKPAPYGSLSISDYGFVLQGGPKRTTIIYHGDPIELHELNLTVGFDSAHFQHLSATPSALFEHNRIDFATETRLVGPGHKPAVGINSLVEISATINGKALTLHDADTIAFLQFVVSNDRTLECIGLPLRWVWQDCADNKLSGRSREYLSRHVYSASYTEECSDEIIRDDLTEKEHHLPTIGGLPELCLEENPKHRTTRTIDFFNGAMRVVCAENIDARGDCNLNGISGEPGECDEFIKEYLDALLGRCKYKGEPLTTQCLNLYNNPDLTGFQAAVNTLPPPPLCPPANHPETLVVTQTELHTGFANGYSIDKPAGALLFVSAGEFPFASGVWQIKNSTIDSATTAGITRILFYAEGNNVLTPGFVTATQGPVSKIYAATPDGRTMVVIRDFQTSIADEDSPVLPESFSLKQNYPNPYNPRTTISFDLPRKTDWELTVYNITGQIIETFSGTDGPGATTISVYSANWASGMYLYRFKAGEYTASRKMVLLK